MKKSSKFLSFVVAAVMTASTMVIPASATDDLIHDKTNQLAMITGVTDNVVKSTGVPSCAGVKSSWAKYDNATEANAEAATLNLSYVEADGSVFVSGRDNKSDGIRQTYANVMSNKTYTAYAYVKLAEGSTAQADFTISVGAANGTYNLIEGQIQSVPNANAKKVNASGWSLVYNTFTVGQNTNPPTDSHEKREERGAHITFALPVKDGKYADYYIKGMTLVETTNGSNLAFTKGTDLECAENFPLNVATNVVTEYTKAAARSGNVGAKVSNYPKDNNTVRITGVKNIVGNTDKLYRASVWVKSAVPGTTVDAYMVATENGSNCPECGKGAPGYFGQSKPFTVGDEWTLVYYDFTPYNHECEKCKSLRTEIHFGPRFAAKDENGAKAVYVDDFCIEEITPAALAVSGEAVSVTPLKANVKLDFSNDITGLAKENIALSDAAATVAISKNSYNSYSLNITGLKPETEYTVTVSNVTDIYGQTLEAGEFKFKTAAAEPTNVPSEVDILSYYGFDGSFESVESTATAVVSKAINHPTTGTVGTRSNFSGIKIAEGNANSGNKSAYFPALESANATRSRITYIPVDRLSSYEVSAYVKLEEAKENVAARLVISAAGNGVIAVRYNVSEPVVLNNTEYKKVTATFNAGPGTGNTYSHVHAAIVTTVDGDDSNVEGMYVDDWTVVERPNFTASVENVENQLVFTFSNNVDLTAENIAVAPATATPVVSGSGKVYTVSLADYNYATTYEVSLKGVMDEYKQSLASAVSGEIVTGAFVAPISGFRVVVDDISQAGGRLSHTVTKDENGVWTVTKGVDELEKWTASKENGGYGYTVSQVKNDMVQKTNITVAKGKKYLATAKVKSLDDIPAGTAYVVFSAAGASAHNLSIKYTQNHLTLDDSEWKTIYAVVSIEDGTACDCAGECKKNSSFIHFGVATSVENVSFMVKDIELCEMVQLSENEDVYAYVKDNGDNTVSLFVQNSKTNTPVYFSAAAYAGEKLAGRSFGADVADKNAGHILIDAVEGAKYMIWDNTLTPLHNTFADSDF